MPFRPNVDETITIDGVQYRVAEHPAAPGMPYGQEGRQGVVYQLHDPDGIPIALKVFKPRSRVPGLVLGAVRLAPYAAIPGLGVCARTVITPRQHTQLLRSHPDLAYAVLMPWMIGPSWMDCILERRALTAEQSLALARSFADLLATMEEQFVAHGDLSGPNLLLPSLATPPAEPMVALVDVEQLYAPGMDRPEQILSGSSGYAHSTTAQGVWGATSDRFAGAVLLAEILAWSDAEIRQASGEESYFEPEELQQAGRQYDLLRQSLKRSWGADIARLLERAWQSATLADCPTFGEWLIALPNVPITEAVQQNISAEALPQRGPEGVMPLLALAAELRNDGVVAGALTAYRRALAMLPEDDGLAMEVRLLIEELAQQQSADAISVVSPNVSSTPQHAEPTSEVLRLSLEERRQIATDARPRRRPIWPFIVLVVALLTIGGGVLTLQAREQEELKLAEQTQVAIQGLATEQAEMASLALTSTRVVELTAVTLRTAEVIGTAEALVLLEGTAILRATNAALATVVSETRSEALTATANAIASRATGEAQLQTAQTQAQSQTTQVEAQRQTAQAQVQVQTAQSQAQRQTAQAQTAQAQEIAQATSFAINQQQTAEAGAAQTAEAEVQRQTAQAQAQVQQTETARQALTGRWRAPAVQEGYGPLWFTFIDVKEQHIVIVSLTIKPPGCGHDRGITGENLRIPIGDDGSFAASFVDRWGSPVSVRGSFVNGTGSGSADIDLKEFCGAGKYRVSWSGAVNIGVFD